MLFFLLPFLILGIKLGVRPGESKAGFFQNRGGESDLDGLLDFFLEKDKEKKGKGRRF